VKSCAYSRTSHSGVGRSYCLHRIRAVRGERANDEIQYSKIGRSGLFIFRPPFNGIILWSLLYYVPLYLEAVKNLSPIMTGVAMFPETFTVAPASVLVGIMISSTGKYMWALWTGWIFTVLGMGLLHFQDLHTPTLGWVFLNLVPGIGTGILFAGIDIAIPAAADTIDMGYAVAFLTFFRTFGQSIGVAVGGCIFQNALQKKLQASPILAPFAERYRQDAMGLVQVIKVMEWGLAKTQLIQPYADSIKTLWLPMGGMAIIGLLSNFIVKQFSLILPICLVAIVLC
jgi:hypothetical protein